MPRDSQFVFLAIIRSTRHPQHHTTEAAYCLALMSSQMSPTSSSDPVDSQNGPSHEITDTQRAQHITALQVVFAGFVASASERGVGFGITRVGDLSLF